MDGMAVVAPAHGIGGTSARNQPTQEPRPLRASDADRTEQVAREFNRMAERLERHDRMNVERVVCQKSKTEAIIESLEVAAAVGPRTWWISFSWSSS
jgi:hypothetical protein